MKLSDSKSNVKFKLTQTEIFKLKEIPFENPSTAYLMRKFKWSFIMADYYAKQLQKQN